MSELRSSVRESSRMYYDHVGSKLHYNYMIILGTAAMLHFKAERNGLHFGSGILLDIFNKVWMYWCVIYMGSFTYYVIS